MSTPQTTAVSIPSVSVNQAQYEALAGGPPVFPTQQELFYYQLGRLKERGCNVEEILPLAEFIPEHGLFLVMPRRPTPLDYNREMGYVLVNGRGGVNYLDSQYLTDEVETPTGPYLMLDVEDGRGRLNTKPSVSHENIKRENRTGYVSWEGIIHATVFPSVLLHHFMDCVGSRYNAKYVPDVCLGDGERPAFGHNWNDRAYPRWGAASCGSRKGLRP